MNLIVAAYDDWGIGKDGTQPITLSADRKFFREITKNCTVIAGRRTVEDFPGKKPLPGRTNIVLTSQNTEIPGFVRCCSPEAAVKMTEHEQNAFVIGGGSVYRQMLPYCQKAYVTKIYAKPESDTFFPNLDEMKSWELTEILQSGEEKGIFYKICLYQKKGTA